MKIRFKIEKYSVSELVPFSNNVAAFIHFLCCFIILSSCENFLSVDLPTNEITREAVFEDDETASASVTALYSKMNKTGFAAGGTRSITLLMELSTDVLHVNSASAANTAYVPFYVNDHLASSQVVSGLWSEMYYLIYSANAIIEGLNNSSKITPALKKQLLGEATFIRAFCYFYLVNLFGDVPYVKTTDYRINSTLGRAESVNVYEEVILDLNQAQSLLREEYVSGERIRPNKWSAVALLSRVYLYIGDWEKAALTATDILNSSMYQLSPPNSVFLKNSPEAIWQIVQGPSSNTNNTQEGNVLIPPSSIGTPDFFINAKLLDRFEQNDLRKSNWISPHIYSTQAYYYPSKYKLRTSTAPAQEYSMVLRLAEQYLIRAEARAQQDDIIGAQSDLNVIRARAGLVNSAASSKETLLQAIEQERTVELFTEWGHRWFDLRRTGRTNEVLAPIKPNWTVDDELLPIPESEILINNNLSQNPSY